MKITLVIESGDNNIAPIVPNDLSFLLEDVAEEMRKSFGHRKINEAHTGEVKSSGWLKHYSGSWILEP